VKRRLSGITRHHGAVTERIVVVGGGIATVRLVEELRRLGSTAEVTVVAAEPYLPYDRPPLSKTVLQGDEAEPPYLRPADTYGDLRVDVRLGARATRLRTDERLVDLEDGTSLAYDALVVATGAAPRRLPDLDGDNVVTLRTFDDAVRLRDGMRVAGRLVIVGAGFIGCEVAASARGLGVDVTVIDLLSAPLVRVLGEEVAAEVTRMHTDAGVDLRMGTTDVPESPVTLVAIGVAPTTQWLEGSGVELADGVRCDASGRTATAGVWAMGDAAAWADPVTGRHRRFEHWTSAGDQAVVVARNLVERSDLQHTLDTVPYLWSDQYGIKIQSLGTPSPADDVKTMTVGPKNRLLAVYGAGGVVTAVVGFGVPRHVMRLRSLLEARASYDDAVAAAVAD
jgi:3-phenylpropionate/trans-cinnamate dioxygenase ferredoxin reductase subunit